MQNYGELNTYNVGGGVCLLVAAAMLAGLFGAPIGAPHSPSCMLPEDKAIKPGFHAKLRRVLLHDG